MSLKSKKLLLCWTVYAVFALIPAVLAGGLVGQWDWKGGWGVFLATFGFFYVELITRRPKFDWESDN